MNLILSEKAATRLAVTLALIMAAVVLFGALRPTPERAQIEPCALVLTANGHECR